MTAMKVLEGVAMGLGDIIPGAPVYIDRIPREIDGSVFVGLVSCDSRWELMNRRVETFHIEILHFLNSEDATIFAIWAEKMHRGLRTVRVGESRVYARELSSRKLDDRTYQVTLSLELVLKESISGKAMTGLSQEVSYGKK